MCVLPHPDWRNVCDNNYTQGQTVRQTPPWTVEQLESSSGRCPFPPSEDRRILSGVKVLEMCRIIAGPIITRILAEYGADVLKVTSPHLSDVPFFQVDGNMGKHAADVDLKTPEGRTVFEELLAEVDVIVDGYRPGAFEKLGYGPDYMAQLAIRRNKGIVYVNENCFGHLGEWAPRPGWQQIADCVSSFPPHPTGLLDSDRRIGQRSSLDPRSIHGAQ